ncbi:MAG: hypothetical protein GY708_31165 [Actinomycetia bacterium]|nr:hypothetical protein [Actinomycetes bacterium]MCP4958604.1 hypothetical protein [Actinomycetes bacterium]
MSRTTLVLGAIATVALVAIALAVVSHQDDEVGESESTATTEPQNLNLAVVAQKDFVETTEIEGTLGFGSPSALPNRASGTVTWLPDPGTIVNFGDILYSVNDVPVVYVPGQIPAYRSMDTKAEGTDVLQLEQWLDDQGFMEPLAATVDGDYTSYTGLAVEDWYEAVYERTGLDTIADGHVVFGTEPFRISSVSTTLGSTINGGSALSSTSQTRLVSVQLDPALSGIIAEGDSVIVELPDESEVEATVTLVADVVTTQGEGQQSQSWIDVELTLAGSGSAFDESPVTVRVEEAIELDAVVVPIPALLALAEGGYAVEIVRDGEIVLVGVQIGGFLLNEASVSGDLRPGEQVIIP